jgi:uncharacterized protein (UPF0303 family)
MSHAADIAKILEQERLLVVDGFSEADAFAIGNAIRVIVENEGLGALIEVRLWDRQLFLCAMRGTSTDNVDWVRRKVNVVQRFQTSSYRKGLELKDAGGQMDQSRGVNPMDYAAAGGGFPIRIKNGPIIGAITVSGLPQRDDHRVVVEALAAHVCVDIRDIELD